MLGLLDANGKTSLRWALFNRMMAEAASDRFLFWGSHFCFHFFFISCGFGGFVFNLPDLDFVKILSGSLLISSI